MLKAVLFDVDGTLAETEEFHRCAFNAVFAQDRIDAHWTVDQYRKLLEVTGGKERIGAYFRQRGLPMRDERILALHLAKNAQYARNLAEGGARLRPGVRRLIGEAAAAGVLLGIATTTSLENLDALLRPAMGPGWSGTFACIVAGDQVPRKKPAPDVYLACLEQLGLKPGEAIAIEDSAVGIAAARGAGLAVLATPSLYTDHHDFSGATALVPHLGDPQQPWELPLPGFAQRWVGIGDLAALAAAGPGASAGMAANREATAHNAMRAA
jgi:HAD superfamily hydrolase (TIGR01509 family)